MGTRGLTCVVKDGEYKVANYNQFDSYPSGQGATALKFLNTSLNLVLFNDKASKIQTLSDEMRQDMLVECGAERGSEWITMDVSNKFKEKFPWLHRECGAEILELIQDRLEGMALSPNLEFAADSLFCEWAYVVDLDKNTFEVYKGFNKFPLESNERFSFLNYKNEEKSNKDKYYPISMVKSYSLFELPVLEQFIQDCDPPEQEEEYD